MTDKLLIWDKIYYGWWHIYNDAFWEWKYLVRPQTTSKYSGDFWYSLNLNQPWIDETTITYRKLK